MLSVKYNNLNEGTKNIFENEPFSNALFSDAPDAIFLLDARDYSIIDCNKKALTLFEAGNKSNLIKLSSFRLYESEPVEFSRNLLESNIRNGGEHSQELAFRTLKQNIFWGKLLKRSVRIANGEYIVLRISKAVEYFSTEEALSNLLRETAKVTGKKFFRALTKLLCKNFDVEVSYIAKFYENGKYFRIIESYGEIKDNNEKHCVKDCITENVFKGYTTFYPTGSCGLFPSDTFVSENEIEGFMGTPVFGNTGEVVGLIALMNRKPIEEIPNSRYILSIFASRTAAEMQRVRSKEILKEQARNLADANNMKDKLLSVISHDLLHPIHSIMGFTDLIHSNSDNYDKSKMLERIDMIDESIKKIYFRLQNLSDWSKMTRNEFRVCPEEILAGAFFRNCLSMFKVLIELKELNVSMNVSDSLILITDKQMLTGIIMNLLFNAIENTPSGGSIALEIYEHNGGIKLVVRDNGKGMDADEIKRISRYKDNLTELDIDINKPGLGLALVYAFVNLLDGSVDIVSDHNKGTEVSITLDHLRKKKRNGIK